MESIKSIFTAFFLMAASSALGANPIVHRDLAYVQPRNERQTLDVYAPAGRTNQPIVIWIHGGAWMTRDKTWVDLKPQAFVDQGCVFVSINYRFFPHVTLKEIAGDVAKAIRFVHDNAGRFGADPNAIFVMGHSAGAQLAALVCTDERYLKAEGLSFDILKGCVPIDGNTFDVVAQVELTEALWERPNPQRGGFRSHRNKFGTTAMQRELSPVTHVAPGKGIPPFLILHIADFPATARATQTTGLQSHILGTALLRVARVPVRVVAVPGKDHNALDRDLGLPNDMATEALFDFVAAQAK